MKIWIDQLKIHHDKIQSTTENKPTPTKKLSLEYLEKSNKKAIKDFSNSALLTTSSFEFRVVFYHFI